MPRPEKIVVRSAGLLFVLAAAVVACQALIARRKRRGCAARHVDKSG